MATITLQRQPRKGKAVPGTMKFAVGGTELTYDTLENADFIISAGKYPVSLTWSPKFRKLLPLIEDVPDRDGLRIHRGTKPEHSTGCVLVNDMAQANIDIMFNYIEKYKEDEKVYIEITDPDGTCA